MESRKREARVHPVAPLRRPTTDPAPTMTSPDLSGPHSGSSKKAFPSNVVPNDPLFPDIDAAPDIAAAPDGDPESVALRQFRKFASADNLSPAWDVYERARQTIPTWRIPEAEFLRFVGAVRSRKNWALAAVTMQEYLRLYTKRSATIRLALAQILLQFLSRPNDAAQTLRGLSRETLTPNESALYDKLVQQLRDGHSSSN